MGLNIADKVAALRKAVGHKEPDGDEGKKPPGSGSPQDGDGSPSANKDKKVGFEEYNKDYIKKHFKKFLKEDGGDGDGDESYDEEYMKKHLKKYMKENGEHVQKNAEELGMLKKSADVVSAAMQENGTELMLVDGQQFMKALVDFAGSIHTSLEKLVEGEGMLKAHVLRGAKIGELSADILGDMATGAVAPAGAPASTFVAPAGAGAAAGAAIMQKAAAMPRLELMTRLHKAVQRGDQTAEQATTYVESCNGDLSKLPASLQMYVESLASAQA